MTATLECLKKFGHDGLSVRRISAEAGVSMGLINHYFPGISGLVAAAYDSLTTTLLEATRAQALAAGEAPRAGLHAFFEASFAPEALDPALFRIWLVFWSLVPHSAEMRAVHDRNYEATRATLEALLGRLRRVAGVPAFRISGAAIALEALIAGLWIELSLNQQSFAATDAVALCDDWVAALASGAFPGLRAGRRA